VPPPEPGNSQTIAGIERALDVLSLVGECGQTSLGVTEIAQSLNLSKAVVHRILASFKAKGFIALDGESRRYTLGPKVLFLGLAYLDRIDVRVIGREVLAELSIASDETATLSVRSGWSRVYVDQVTPLRDVTMQVTLGAPHPLHAGASSKAFLAFLPAAEQEEYLTHHELEKLTGADVPALREELGHIRRGGYAGSLGEQQSGAAVVAAPVMGHDGQPLAVISIVGPVERFAERTDELADLLVQATRRASVRAGWRGTA
jgi:IclR family acetate operon transcriptional repressor